MNNLKPIEHNGFRVLTTAQLAESFGAEVIKVQQNFNNNKSRYTEGKHFFLLQGDELKSLKGNLENFEVASNLNRLYLWTEKGAWLHAKSLNTDSAWEAYEALVDDYYTVKQQSIDTSLLSPEMQMFKHMFDGVAKMQIESAQTQQKLIAVESAVSAIKETFLQRDENWRDSINRMINATARSNGNYQELRNESYRLLEERGHCDLNTRLRNLKDRLEDSGATKSKINSISRMDVVEADPKLREIYTTIVKELSIGTLA